jgi:uncharacterized repeat protein (TIGR01451 family)
VNVTDLLGAGLAYEAGSLYISGNTTNYRVYVYTNVGTFSFTPPAGVNEVEYLVVGGGGGGGGISAGNTGGAGGGGAGGFLSNLGGAGYPVSSTQSYTVVVGGGGAPGVGLSSPGGQGGQSRFATIIAAGGGGGASIGDNNGVAGGSGGGGRLNSSGLGGAGTVGQGTGGGNGASSGGSAGGGGGASEPGTDGNTGGVGGDGGDGEVSDITGVSTTYAGGGGGGGYESFGGDGGDGGGGSAPNSRGAGNDGERNTGGGGSGAAGASSGETFDGGAGGSGIVVIRHLAGSFGPPPNLVSGYNIGPGETLTIVFTAEVFAVSAVTNRACLTTDIITNALCATVINLVDTSATPDRVSGQVRFDPDGDGDLGEPDFGISGVTVQIYTDPNGDGNPVDGVQLDSTVTDLFGYYLFGGLTNGSYVVIQVDRPGYTSTGDSDGGDPNRIAVTLLGGVDSRDNDFLDRTISGLTISKTTTAEEIIIPGETIPYVILVSNTRPVNATGVTVVDYLPEGIAYMADSAWVDIAGLTTSEDVLDLFDVRVYNNQNGSMPWSSNWQEISDDNSATAGDVAIITDLGANRLRIRDDSNGIRRTADLSGGSYLALSYFYRRAGLEAGEYVMVQIATNPAGPFTELIRHEHEAGGASSQSDSSYQFATHDVTAFASSETTLRLLSPSGGMADGDQVFFDDIRFEYGSSENISQAGSAPPLMVTNVTLSPGATIRIAFTTEVVTADVIINTGLVFTATDTNGLTAYTTNIVGDVIMTQGMIVGSAELPGVRVGWTAYTNESGEVTKDYDVMWVDNSVWGFHPSLTSQWQLATTLQDSILVDTGSPTRLPPAQIGNKMRFYRASFRGAWDAQKPLRFATREVYVAKCVHLKEGENLISFFAIPDDNRLAVVLGTNRLPAGATLGDSTRVEWYAQSPQTEATNVVFLSNAGIWQRMEGGLANDMPLPLDKGFNLILPPGSGERDLLLVGRVPTNVSAQAGHQITVAGVDSYSVVSINLPYRLPLKDSGLREAGFTGVPAGRAFNPRYSDEIRIMKKGDGTLGQPAIRILMNSTGQFQYWTGGSGSAENHALEPDDGIIIYTRMSTSNLTWNIPLPYPEPTLFMTP